LTYDEQYVKVEEFIEPFKTIDSLEKKPKFFFIDACRGSNMMPTVERFKNNVLANIANEKQEKEIKLEYDFLIVHSTVDNYFSFSSKINGSWFMHSLCLMITKYKETRDIHSIMSEVSNHVLKKEYLSDDDKIFKMFPSCRYKLLQNFKFPVNFNLLIISDFLEEICREKNKKQCYSTALKYLFTFHSKKNATQATNSICLVNSDLSFDVLTCQRCYGRFSSGDFISITRTVLEDQLKQMIPF
jgi:hypothetical protein